MRRYIMTGAPGSGKTSILRVLASRGLGVIPEAATDVIAAEQASGVAEPWTRPSFIDKIVGVQRERQLLAAYQAVPVQVFDRAPICTYALSTWLGFPVSAGLSAELGRIARDRVYQREVFFVGNLGFCEPTAARRISFEESLEFERVHAATYRTLGYELIQIPAAAVADRATAVMSAIRGHGT